jgi:hypothetical protein
MAEFMIVMIPAMIILFVAVQFAVIARDATALGQFTSQAARLAAAPSGSAWDCGALVTHITNSSKTSANIMPQPVAVIVKNNGISCTGSATPTPNGVTVTMNCPGTAGGCTARTQGSQVQVVIAMSITNDLFLGKTFLGVGFPNSLSNEASAMTQGG